MKEERTHRLLQATEQEMKMIKYYYNSTDESLQRDVEALIEWFTMQPHLPKVELDRTMVEALYIVNKVSMERTKERLDMRFTCKVILPELFANRDPKQPSIQNAFKGWGYAPMPKLCPDLARLNIFKIIDPNPDLYDPITFFKVLFMISEKRLMSDHCIGDRLLIDLDNLSMSHFLKINPMIISKTEIANKKVFGNKICGIHIINGPAFLEKFVALLKHSLKKKVADRIKVYSNLDDLFQDIPKDVLPKDYGGSERYFEDIVGDWRDELEGEKLRNHFIEQDKLASDESKRPPDAVINDMLGMPGSFKKLVID